MCPTSVQQSPKFTVDSRPSHHPANLPHFKELDGIRGIACLAVFVHHFLQPFKGGWLVSLSKYGASGVDVFFVLSGFLITSLLLIDREKPHYFSNFYWKRAIRILPPYIVYMVLIERYGHWSYVLLCLFFIANFAGRFHLNFQSVAWTLSIEEQFYLIWPYFVRRLRLKTLYTVAFALVLTSILLRIIVPLATGRIALGYTPYRFDGLGLGGILALQWFAPAEIPRPIRPLLKLMHSKWLLALAGLSATAVLSMASHDESLLMAGARICIVNYLTYRLIRRIIHPKRSPSWLGRAAPVYFGRVSYSFYLYHPVILALVMSRISAMGESFVVAFGATLAMSTVSLYAMELPIQRFRRLVLRDNS